MSKYASLLFPPDRYHEIGPFRFPVYEDLVPGEARGFEQLSKKQSRHTFNSIKLAQRIARDKGITTKEAVELLADTSEDKQDIFYEYAADLDELQQLSMTQSEQKVTLATLIIQYRGEVRVSKGDKWQKLEDWTEVDTEKVPGKILDQIMQFMNWEKDGWPDTMGKNEEGDESLLQTNS